MSEKKRKRKGERKDGRIQVTASGGFDENGKRIRLSFYGKTRAEAERKRDAYFAMGNKFVDLDISVAEWIELYKRTYRTRVNAAYLSQDNVPYNRLSKAIGHMRLADVMEIDLQNCLNDVSGMSESTIDKYQQTIKRVFLRAFKNRLISFNPAEDLIIPDGTSGSHRALERWEIDLIFKHWRIHRAGLWALLMMLAGLRRGELIALRWENIDMDSRQINVCEVAVIVRNQIHVEQRAKSEAGIRILPICAPLWDALNETPKEKRTGLVCVSSKGKMHTESSFSRGWEFFNRAMNRIIAGEPAFQNGKRTDLEGHGEPEQVFNVKCHDLRHTFATALFEAGVPAKAAQYYLGHADIRITLELYTHLTKEKEKATRSQIVGFLDGWLRLTNGGGSNEPDDSTENA